MSASGVQLNWSNVEFASTALTRVTSVAFSMGGEAIDFAGDNNRYPVIIANNVNRPSCTITGGDVAALMGLTGSGAITATQEDALGVVGGAINWTLANAVHINSDDSGSWGQFAAATATFRAYASDGATNPLTFTRT